MATRQPRPLPSRPRRRPHPARAGTLYDGTYVGTAGGAMVFGSKHAFCPPLPKSQVTVANGNLRTMMATRNFFGPVGADGKVELTSFSNGYGGFPGQISGQIDNNAFDGTFTYRQAVFSCTYPLNGFTKR